MERECVLFVIFSFLLKTVVRWWTTGEIWVECYFCRRYVGLNGTLEVATFFTPDFLIYRVSILFRLLCFIPSSCTYLKSLLKFVAFHIEILISS